VFANFESTDEDAENEKMHESRTRGMTEKGRCYTALVKKKILHMSELLKRLMSKGPGADRMEVEILYAQWLGAYESFLTTYDSMASLMSQDELDDLKAQHEDRKLYLLNVKNWLCTNKPISRAGSRKSHTDRADGSYRAPSSSVRTLASAKIAEEQRRAELIAKASMLKEKQDLDRAK
jgi:hypothetical protein